jgi:hypothetical protein
VRSGGSDGLASAAATLWRFVDPAKSQVTFSPVWIVRFTGPPAPHAAPGVAVKHVVVASDT